LESSLSASYVQLASRLVFGNLEDHVRFPFVFLD
jgi:hypothetical protein